ncbi:MAG: hypothetical protein HRT37_02145 [Alteromonadaceae bacterium]|nr:hypothetical protein [Alteromonadaceae bacterium]
MKENVFVRCNGEAAIISNKCAGNIYCRNVFNQCNGELVMRGEFGFAVRSRCQRQC